MTERGFTGAEQALAAVAFVVAVVLGAPGLTWHDGGELALAAATAGVAHAPGEPAWITLAALAARLPIGELPFRLALLSAATVAGCAAGLSWVVRQEAGATAGLFAGALFGASSALQLQGVRPELYALAMLLGLLAVAGAQIGGRRGLAVAVLPCAIAGAVHPAMLVAAVPGLAMLATRSGLRAWGAAIASAAVLIVPGAGQMLWLPLRSRRDPALDFNNPETFDRVLHVASARGYARSFELVEGQLAANLLDHGRMAVEELGPVSLVLAALALGVHRSRATLAGLLFVGFGILPSAMQSAFQWHNPDLRGYLLGPVAALCAGAGVGAAWGIDQLRRRAPNAARPVAIALVLATVGLALTGTARRANLSDLQAPRRLGASMLDAAPPGALLLPQGDTWVYPPLYQRWWEGRRADTRLAILHDLDVDRLRDNHRRLRLTVDHPVFAQLEAAPPPTGVQAEWMLRALVAAGVGPVLVTDGFLPPELLLAQQPVGPWLRLDGPGDPAAEDRWWTETLQPLSACDGWAADRVARVGLARRFGTRAGWWRGRGDGARAAALFDRGALLGADPTLMIQWMRYRLQEGMDAPGTGGVPVGPWVPAWVRGDDAAAEQALLAIPDCVDCRVAASASAVLRGDYAGATDQLRPVLAADSTHPTGLLVAERLYTLGFTATPR